MVILYDPGFPRDCYSSEALEYSLAGVPARCGCIKHSPELWRRPRHTPRPVPDDASSGILCKLPQEEAAERRRVAQVADLPVWKSVREVLYQNNSPVRTPPKPLVTGRRVYNPARHHSMVAGKDAYDDLDG